MSDAEKKTDYIYLDYSEHYRSIPLYLILTVFTCGLFNLYWNYRQMVACNDMLGEDEFSFWMWFLLSLVTCGFYHIYYQYRMGSVIVEIQREQGERENKDLPVISLIFSFIFPIIVDCIHQNEINKLAS